tara:strand:- start:3513 stop:4277 length:765 start_codon:yes stop_codon:yes gene_type:complete
MNMSKTQTHDETTTDVVHVFNVTTKEWGDDPMQRPYNREYTKTHVITDDDVAMREISDFLIDEAHERVMGTNGYRHFPFIHGDEFATEFDSWCYDNPVQAKWFVNAMKWEAMLDGPKHHEPHTFHGMYVNRSDDLIKKVRRMPETMRGTIKPDHMLVRMASERLVSGKDKQTEPWLVHMIERYGGMEGFKTTVTYTRVEVRKHTSNEWEVIEQEREYEAYRNSEQYKQDLQDERDAALRESELGNPNTYEREMI